MDWAHLQNLKWVGTHAISSQVITIEPGCYFVDVLLDAVLADPTRAAFFDAKRLAEFRRCGVGGAVGSGGCCGDVGGGGVRVEDCIVIWEPPERGGPGNENLNAALPRTVHEVWNNERDHLEMQRKIYVKNKSIFCEIFKKYISRFWTSKAGKMGNAARALLCVYQGCRRFPLKFPFFEQKMATSLLCLCCWINSPKFDLFHIC